MKGYVSKKIVLDRKLNKYCIVRVYPTRKKMQDAYKAFRPSDTHHYKVLGAHCGYTKYEFNDGKKGKMLGETGTVFLSRQNLGAGVVSHELMHAVFWAQIHRSRYLDQHPFTIKDMAHEEKLLHAHTSAVQQFYDFYWKKIDPPKK